MSDAWDRVKEIFEEAKGLVPKSERAASNLVLAWAIMELVELPPDEMVKSYLASHLQPPDHKEAPSISPDIRDKLIPHRELFSERIANVFERDNILTWGNLCDLDKDALVKLKNFGAGCLTDVRRILRQRGLFLCGEEPSEVDGELIE